MDRDKRYFILEKCCIQIKLCTPHMRQFLIHRRNQWKIFSLKVRREKEKWIFLVFLTKLSLEKPSLGSKISEEMLVVFMKGKRKVVLRRSYIFICIEFVNMCDIINNICFLAEWYCSNCNYWFKNITKSFDLSKEFI